MTNLTPCERHEMIGCTVCSPRPKPEPAEDSHPFLARYDGQCPSCDLPIRAGADRIVMRDGGHGSYAIHEDCAG